MAPARPKENFTVYELASALRAPLLARIASAAGTVVGGHNARQQAAMNEANALAAEALAINSVGGRGRPIERGRSQVDRSRARPIEGRRAAWV